MHAHLFTCLLAGPLASLLAMPAATLAQLACEPLRVPPAPGTPPNDFASALGTNGRQWLFGDGGARTWCPGDPFSCAAGALHSYELFDGVLEHVQTIVPPDIFFADNFGDTVAVDGDRMLVGMPGRDWPDTRLVGGAIMYEYVDGWWVEVDRLRPPPGFDPDIEFSGFGGHIALDGDLALLRPSRADAGVIMVFHRTADGWSFRESIEAPDGVPGDAVFGEYPALSDNWLVVSARNDSTAADRAGSVYVYRRQADDTLEFAQKIYSPGPQELERFGYSLAHEDTTLIVGAYLADRPLGAEGAVFVYGVEDERWVLRQEIVLSDAQLGDGFGGNVHLDGDLLLVQARGRRDGISAGKVFRFERGADGLWREIGELVPNPPVWARSFGWAMTSWGGASGLALIGSPDDVTLLPTANNGAAYIFDLTCNSCPPDLDADGRLTVFDFLTFLNLFDDGDMQADFDGDGELTVFDFLAFQTAFDAGCE